MKQIMLSLLIALGVLSEAQICMAQELQRNRFGIGISIEPALFGSTLYYYTRSLGPQGSYVLSQPEYASLPMNIYLPINVTPRFRIEPVLGMYSFQSEETSTTSSAPSPGKSDATLTHIGLGVYYLIPGNNKFQMYVGPRLGLNFATTTSSSLYYSGSQVVDGEVKTTETDFAAGLSFGGEYSLIREFSIGAEVDANYVFFGNPDVTYTPPPAPTTAMDRKQYIITTDALFFIRWYFVTSPQEQE